MQENINALDEIHKGACMGVDAVTYVLDKVEDQKLEKELKREKEAYEDIERRIEEIYPKYDEDSPHSTSALNKAMTMSKVELETLMDQSNSHIAEFLLKGVNMGVIEGRKILNKKNLNEEVENIVAEYVSMQEKAIESLKSFL